MTRSCKGRRFIHTPLLTETIKTRGNPSGEPKKPPGGKLLALSCDECQVYGTPIGNFKKGYRQRCRNVEIHLTLNFVHFTLNSEKHSRGPISCRNPLENKDQQKDRGRANDEAAPEPEVLFRAIAIVLV